MVIRDETLNVARKARARVGWQKDASPPLEIVKSTKPQTDWFEDFASQCPISRSTCPVPIEDQGFCFVFTYYIVADSTLPNGHPDHFSSKTWKIVSSRVVWPFFKVHSQSGKEHFCDRWLGKDLVRSGFMLVGTRECDFYSP